MCLNSQACMLPPGTEELSCDVVDFKSLVKMFSRAAVRATTQVAGRRGFHATRSQMSSPYHYPEGPYTNIPFNPKKKTFPLLFWGYCATGFSAPFLIAAWQTYKPR
ncbi:hypothetical protein DHEL01_v201653 [Diaporthe helianthi]|uniref:Cytochrome c oxidase subunit 8, mitochondrial n=1 Tax=Diaporthe helianthi TaxID=158607 RepID=A0A2P5IBT0_DIAHE|nr:hypothetical protein DHEL01_v201653 [Diaporthe helianthi]